MRKGRFLMVTIAFVAFVGLIGSAAQAIPPTDRAYFGFWEFNIDGEGFTTIDDCVQIDGGRFCSLIFGKCGPIEITGMDDTIVNWTASLRNVGPGRIDLVGQTELRGPGSASNATGFWGRPVKSNLSLDMSEDETCTWGPPFDPFVDGGPEQFAPRASEIIQNKLEGWPNKDR